MYRTLLTLLIIGFFAAAAVAAEDKPAGEADAESRTEVSREKTADPFAEFEDKFSEKQKQLMQDFQSWYDKSREAGEKSKDWIVNDIKGIGDWEYLVVTLPAGSEAQLSEQLNSYGQDRWEVYWVQKTLQGIQFYFKRPVRTYIKHIPVGDLLHIMPNNQQP